MVTSLVVVLVEDLLYTSQKTPPILGAFSPEEVPRAGHQILKQAVLERRFFITWSILTERYLWIMVVSIL